MYEIILELLVLLLEYDTPVVREHGAMPMIDCGGVGGALDVLRTLASCATQTCIAQVSGDTPKNPLLYIIN